MSLSVSQATRPVASYYSILLGAQKAFNGNLATLQAAVADSETKGSIAHQIGKLDRRTKEMNAAPIIAKHQFIQFMDTQLEKYKTAKKTQESGLEAIRTITNAKTECVLPKPAELLAIKELVVKLAHDGAKFEKSAERNRAAISAYNFDAQLQELTPLVAKVTEQIAALEISLGKGFYAISVAENTVGYLDIARSYTSYFVAALAEKNKPAPKQELAVVNS